MHRVFFDANAGSKEFGYLLYFDRSKKDLAKLGTLLKPGAKVIIYDPGEFELESILAYDEDFHCWKAIPTKI